MLRDMRDVNIVTIYKKIKETGVTVIIIVASPSSAVLGSSLLPLH